jgi:Flp pilus assembly protein TadG
MYLDRYRSKRRERGATMIIVLVALVALIAMSSLAIDVGILWTARTQLQNAADAAALAGALNLIDPTGPTVTAGAATTAAIQVCGRNGAVGSESLVLPTSDVLIGNWDISAGTFDPNVDLGDPDAVTAVNVDTRLDSVANGPVPAFFSRVLGRQAFDVGAMATAYLGFAGSVGPGQIDLPIAIDCCKLRGPNCSEDYCTTVATNPPNPCDLAAPQDDGITTVSCLQFDPTNDQNACWTQLSESEPSINSNDLRDIIQAGNPFDLTNTMSIFLDNGEKASVTHELANAFYGDAGYSSQPRGMDRYSPFDGVSDSWVQGVTVVECQDQTHCATGSNARIVGFVCVEIREIERSPLNLIRLRFLCPDDPLFRACDIGRTGTGGLDFGVRADIPVLVR